MLSITKTGKIQSTHLRSRDCHPDEPCDGEGLRFKADRLDTKGVRVVPQTIPFPSRITTRTSPLGLVPCCFKQVSRTFARPEKAAK